MSEDPNIELDKQGFSNIIDFCKQYPLETISELSQLLGKDIAPIQILSLLREECGASKNMSYFAIDILIRSLYQFFPKGWLPKGHEDNTIIELFKGIEFE